MSDNNSITGLSSAQAAEKLSQFGTNEIKKQKSFSYINVFLEQLKSPLVYVLIFAGSVTWILGEGTDSLVIFAAVGINTILGFFQEIKAEQSLAALSRMIIHVCWVVRDGKEVHLPAGELVPGDVVIIKTGEKIPADGLVVEAVDLYINEAILTGEAEPINKSAYHEDFKDRKNADENHLIYSGTTVLSGRGKMLVEATGGKTKFGQIASTLEGTTSQETPLKKEINQLSKLLAIVMGSSCVVIFVVGLGRGIGIAEMFALSAAVAVAAIPEGLVISVTTALALGMQKLLAAHALVRQLLSAESLGSVTCICLDKTGTLTKGIMKVIASETSSHRRLLHAAFLSGSRIGPLEMAMNNWAGENLNKKDKESLVLLKKLDEMPFSSKRKYSATLFPDYLYVSGAPEKIFSYCKMPREEQKKWLAVLDNHTQKSYRVIAFAGRQRKTTEIKINSDRLDKSLNFIGLLVFDDPVRNDVGEVLDNCKVSGIKIKIITGDYCQTAKAILKKIGFSETELEDKHLLSGEQLTGMSSSALANIIDDIVLFYRTSPQQKIKIVQALQAKGEIVAMMGDGINDTLALKKADIGVVVGEATQVAKEIADLVLLDSNFKTIISAVRIGRDIVKNVRKIVLYLLSNCLTEVSLVGTGLVLGLPLPLSASQILWINLVQDGLPGIALAFEPGTAGSDRERLKKNGRHIIDRELTTLLLITGLVLDGSLFLLYFVLYNFGIDPILMRTIIFTSLGLDSLLYIFSSKSLRGGIWQTNIFNNIWLNISVIFGLGMMVGAIYLPYFNNILHTVQIPVWAFSLLIYFALVKVALIEFIKWLWRGDYR